MTDNERIKWLNKTADKTKNTIHSNCDVHLFIDDFIATVDLINRQKAESERLQKENEFHRKTITENAQRALEVLVDEIDKAKIEAYKEFADRAKEKFLQLEFRLNSDRKTMRIQDVKYYGNVLLHETGCVVIDNIVKEMVGKSFTKIEHDSLCETETYKGGE